MILPNVSLYMSMRYNNSKDNANFWRCKKALLEQNIIIVSMMMEATITVETSSKLLPEHTVQHYRRESSLRKRLLKARNGNEAGNNIIYSKRIRQHSAMKGEETGSKSDNLGRETEAALSQFGMSYVSPPPPALIHDLDPPESCCDSPPFRWHMKSKFSNS